jgi:hypothetical protein
MSRLEGDAIEETSVLGLWRAWLRKKWCCSEGILIPREGGGSVHFTGAAEHRIAQSKPEIERHNYHTVYLPRMTPSDRKEPQPNLPRIIDLPKPSSPYP